jgi:hypothetical protein
MVTSSRVPSMHARGTVRPTTVRIAADSSARPTRRRLRPRSSSRSTRSPSGEVAMASTAPDGRSAASAKVSSSSA